MSEVKHQSEKMEHFKIILIITILIKCKYFNKNIHSKDKIYKFCGTLACFGGSTSPCGPLFSNFVTLSEVSNIMIDSSVAYLTG